MGKLFKPINLCVTPTRTLLVPFSILLLNSTGRVGKEVVGAEVGASDGVLEVGNADIVGSQLGVPVGSQEGQDEGKLLGIVEYVGRYVGSADGSIVG